MPLSFEKKGNTEDDKHVDPYSWTPGGPGWGPGPGGGIKLCFHHGFEEEGVNSVELFLDYTVKLTALLEFYGSFYVPI